MTAWSQERKSPWLSMWAARTSPSTRSPPSSRGDNGGWTRTEGSIRRRLGVSESIRQGTQDHRFHANSLVVPRHETRFSARRIPWLKRQCRYRPRRIRDAKKLAPGALFRVQPQLRGGLESRPSLLMPTPNSSRPIRTRRSALLYAPAEQVSRGFISKWSPISRAANRPDDRAGLRDDPAALHGRKCPRMGQSGRQGGCVHHRLVGNPAPSIPPGVPRDDEDFKNLENASRPRHSRARRHRGALQRRLARRGG